MSDSLSILNSQNLNRAQAVAGLISTASQTFNNANVSTTGRIALAGSLLNTLGGVLTGFTSKSYEGEGFNIGAFSSRVNKFGGFASTSKFLVSITPPGCMGVNLSNILNNANALDSITDFVSKETNLPDSTFKDIAGDMIFLCSAAAIPGVKINTQGISHFGYGTQEQRPISADFNYMNLNFYVDVGSEVYTFFTKWMNNIVNFNDDAVGSKTSDSAFYNEVQYKSKYASPTISIYVFDVSGNQFMEVKLIDAFPVELGQVNLSWGNYTDIAVLPVKIAYKNWKSNYTPSASISTSALRNLTLADTLMKAGSIVSGVSTLFRRPTNIADTFNLVNNAGLLKSVLIR